MTAENEYTVVGYYEDDYQPFGHHVTAPNVMVALTRLREEMAEGDEERDWPGGPVVVDVFRGHLVSVSPSDESFSLEHGPPGALD